MAGVISRVFDAPCDLVWEILHRARAYEAMVGPEGFTVIASKMDLRVGGTYHSGMKAPDGTSM